MEVTDEEALQIELEERAKKSGIPVVPKSDASEEKKGDDEDAGKG
jgi:hypothetical protein